MPAAEAPHMRSRAGLSGSATGLCRQLPACGQVRRRRATKPIAIKPAIIRAYVSGSGTAITISCFIRIGQSDQIGAPGGVARRVSSLCECDPGTAEAVVRHSKAAAREVECAVKEDVPDRYAQADPLEVLRNGIRVGVLLSQPAPVKSLLKASATAGAKAPLLS